jgi:tetratricopeptide (TPR) repeat protein
MASSLHRWFLLLPLIVAPLAQVSFAQVMTVPTKPAASSAASSTQQLDPAERDKVIADINAKKFDDALVEAKAILAAHPDSSQANKLVGVVLLDDQKAADALSYFLKALALDANDPSVHALLLQAYAQSGDRKNRDAQREILRGYHTDGKHPDFARSLGFTIETIPFVGKAVQAFEFYEPAGKFHLYYRFNVYDTLDGHLQSFYALESDDIDQVNYAKEHPKEASAGERRFSIDVYSRNAAGNPTQGLIAFIDGKPAYDDVRAQIIKIMDKPAAPAAATTDTVAPKSPQ